MSIGIKIHFKKERNWQWDFQKEKEIRYGRKE